MWFPFADCLVFLLSVVWQASSSSRVGSQEHPREVVSSEPSKRSLQDPGRLDTAEPAPVDPWDVLLAEEAPHPYRIRLRGFDNGLTPIMVEDQSRLVIAA